MAWINGAASGDFSVLSFSLWLYVPQASLDASIGGDTGNLPIFEIGQHLDPTTLTEHGFVNGNSELQCGADLSLGTWNVGASGAGDFFPGLGMSDYPTTVGSDGNVPDGGPFEFRHGTIDSMSTGSFGIWDNHTGDWIRDGGGMNPPGGPFSYDMSGIYPPGTLIRSMTPRTISPNVFAVDIDFGIPTTFDEDVPAVSPSAFALGSDGVPFFNAVEGRRTGDDIVLDPRQNEYSVGGSPIVTNSWNHMAASVDNSTGLSTFLLNGQANTCDFSGPSYQPFDMSRAGDGVGIPIVPSDFGKFLIVGPNQKLRYAYFQLWIGQYIDWTNSDNWPPIFARRRTGGRSRLVPPANIQAAQKAFGVSDIWCYRDKNKRIQFADNHGTAGSLSGSTPTDYTPGPGQ